LRPYEWYFPFLGAVSYKGFFKYEKGLEEQQELNLRGYDTDLSEVSAWSTLGWFRDPIFSEMLSRDEGSLAELIIHEMTHATIYLKSSVEFNENFASMIGEEGAIRFLRMKYGDLSRQMETYLNKKHDYDLFARYMLDSYRQLDSLFKEMGNSLSQEEKRKRKWMQISRTVSGLHQISFRDQARYVKIFSKKLPNNAYFYSFKRYDEQKDSLRIELVEKFNRDIKAYVYYKKQVKFN
jgi:predicted aminopeptidase